MIIREKKSALLATFGLLLAVQYLGGCSGEESVPTSPGPPEPWSLQEIQDQILTPSCVLSCHDAQIHAGGLNLTSGASHGEMVNVPSIVFPEIFLVKPGEPDESLLVMTVQGEGLTPSMPPGEMDLLLDPAVAQLRNWISRGAPEQE